MYQTVNGARIFFESIGPHLISSQDHDITRPTLLVMHGGPGHEHSGLRAHFDRYADVVHVLYLDHRGNGRSRGGTGSDPGTWNLDQWAQDVADLCDSLGIEAPIVYGQSFGGMVAQRFAVRFPGRARGHIFSSTTAKFDVTEVVDAFADMGGATARDLAQRFWTRMTDADVRDYFAVCGPLYTYGSESIPGTTGLFRDDVLRHFSSETGEIHRMDQRADLPSIAEPVLVVTGDRDPVTPASRSREIAGAVGDSAELVEIAGAGHGAYRDKPREFETALRAFIHRVTTSPR